MAPTTAKAAAAEMTYLDAFMGFTPEVVLKNLTPFMAMLDAG
jgi:hypothetical protein